MNSEVLLLILGMALVTYIPRALPALLINKLKFSRLIEKFLQLIPYTAMAALIFPGILTVDSEFWWIGACGGVAAIVMAWNKLPLAFTVVGSVVVVMCIYLIL